MRTRWSLILTDYVAIREAVLASPRLMAQTDIQLFELNQRTLSQWFSRCQKDRGVSVLLQGTGVFPAAAVAVQPLPPAKGLSFVPVGQGQPFKYNIPEMLLVPAGLGNSVPRNLCRAPASPLHLLRSPPAAAVSSRRQSCRCRVHLSDSAGMPILKITACEESHSKGDCQRRGAKSPQLDPSKWTVIGQGRKRSQHDEPEQSIDALKQAGTVRQEELEESYLPLTAVWFSSAMLVEMDKISPSHLPGPDECTPKRQKKAKMELKQRAPASKRTLAKRQGEAAPMVVEVILRPPTSRGTVAVEQQVCALCVKDVLSE
ncbi:hypothetical protein JOQ06_004029 [Pogonophryne albipinna]|uniref:Uncharacterized protein n=1 Tax=Pogonophryne albipinna TaxID=1090488 RepID=A0AAD6ABD2_9TELE|nr:hypothetical protein JOQ06_004029 [Pogonophryne albipinna]